MRMDSNAPIGVFDSGIGGLTVAREIMRNLPMEKIVYFGDTARLPYGSKSQETVLRYSRQIVRFLQNQGVKAIVVACNTASALALDTLEKEMDIPILGIVENMSYLECPDCKKKISVFGESHVEEIAGEHGLKVLAKIPIDPTIAQMVDGGQVEYLEMPWFGEAVKTVESL